MRHTVAQAAARLGVSRQSIYRYVADGRLGCTRTDGRVLTRLIAGRPTRYLKSGRLLFADADLERWEAAHRVEARAAAPVSSDAIRQRVIAAERTFGKFGIAR